MTNIVQEFTVKAPPDRVFQVMSRPEGLARWWTKTLEGNSEEGAEYSLFFGLEYDWRGRVTRYKPHSAFELEITKAHPDGVGTRVGCNYLNDLPRRTALGHQGQHDFFGCETQRRTD